MEREQAGFGIVQRVENVVHEAGAEAPEGGHFFSLDELGLGLLDFVVSSVQGDVLLAQLGVEDFQVAVAFFKVMFAFVQFVAKSKFSKPQQVVKMTADDYENTGYKQKVDVIKKDALVKSGALQKTSCKIEGHYLQKNNDAVQQSPAQDDGRSQQDQIQPGIVR